MQAHPWFIDVDWDKLYDMEAAFKPEVNGELDTRNFMKFDEVQTVIFAFIMFDAFYSDLQMVISYIHYRFQLYLCYTDVTSYIIYLSVYYYASLVPK